MSRQDDRPPPTRRALLGALQDALRTLRAWERWASTTPGVEASPWREGGPPADTWSASSQAIERRHRLECRHPQALADELPGLPCPWPYCPRGVGGSTFRATFRSTARVVDGVRHEPGRRGSADLARVRTDGGGWAWVAVGYRSGREDDHLSDEEIRRRRRRGSRAACSACAPGAWHWMTLAGPEALKMDEGGAVGLRWTLAREPAGHEPVRPWRACAEDRDPGPAEESASG